MKILINLFILLTGLIYGCKPQFPIVVETISANVKSETSVIVTGQIHSGGDADIASYGFCISNQANPTIKDTRLNFISTGYPVGEFKDSFENLTANVTYHIRAYAINSEDVGYGNDLKVIPHDLPVANVINVKTLSADLLTNTSLIAIGRVISGGSSAILSYGICISLNPNPTISETRSLHHSEDYLTEDFKDTFPNLNVKSTYYVRAYAVNSEQTGYGENLTVVTPPAINFIISKSNRDDKLKTNFLQFSLH